MTGELERGGRLALWSAAAAWVALLGASGCLQTMSGVEVPLNDAGQETADADLEGAFDADQEQEEQMSDAEVADGQRPPIDDQRPARVETASFGFG